MTNAMRFRFRVIVIFSVLYCLAVPLWAAQLTVVNYTPRGTVLSWQRDGSKAVEATWTRTCQAPGGRPVANVSKVAIAEGVTTGTVTLSGRGRWDVAVSFGDESTSKKEIIVKDWTDFPLNPPKKGDDLEGSLWLFVQVYSVPFFQVAIAPRKPADLATSTGLTGVMAGQVCRVIRDQQWLMTRRGDGEEDQARALIALFDGGNMTPYGFTMNAAQRSAVLRYFCRLAKDLQLAVVAAGAASAATAVAEVEAVDPDAISP